MISVFNSRFPGEPELARSPRFSSSTCSGREPLGVSGTGFYRSVVLPVTQPTVSKAMKETQITDAS